LLGCFVSKLNLPFLECALFGICSFFDFTHFECPLLGMCFIMNGSFWNVLFLDYDQNRMYPFWNVPFLEFALFGRCPFWMGTKWNGIKMECADRLTIFKPGRADYPQPLLLAPPNFFTFRHHCIGFQNKILYHFSPLF